MDGTFNTNDFPPHWLIYTCRWLWARLLGWWSIGFSLFWNIVAALFIFPISPFAELTQLWAFQYKISLIVGLPMLLCFTLFIGFISKFETTPSLYTRQQHYLRQMLIDHTSLKASGIPKIFFPPSAKLEEVFIPLEFINERPPIGIDYPLRTEEIPLWQHIFATRKKRPPNELMVRLSLEKSVGITSFWQSLSRDSPVAIILGYSGMGKSILMKRLTLHMARRCLKKSDPRLPKLFPALIPVLIELKKYADALKKAQEIKEDLSILSYLPQMLHKRAWQGKDPWPFIKNRLEQGECLILFDGLDEAGDVELRMQVARAINTFILDQRNTPPERKTFNRFIITSRMAGYHSEAFPDALPYRISELTEAHMHDLLKLWYKAMVKAEPAAQEAEARMQRLHTAIREHGPIFRLAENPLLLMLMAAMQKCGINLPRERTELFDKITLTLLQYREKDKELPQIDEDEAIHRLGPLAYAMQTTEYIADEHAVLDSLRKTIGEEYRRSVITSTQGNDYVSDHAEIEKQVNAFLTLIRERSNLFVQRTGENYSFFHKSFQEYFAARFILKTIQNKRDKEITSLVEMARMPGDMWREPFLFAIGYQSLGHNRDQTLARDLLQELLETSKYESDPERRLHDLLLAANALIEAKAKTFEEALEKQIVQGLIPSYMQAQSQKNFDDCQKIERALKSWLLTLTLENSQSPLLVTLSSILQDGHRTDLQRATLTLLVIILPDEDYPQPLYETLIPLLLGLANLPPINQPISHISTVDYTVADLALVTLSRMGRHGPAGLFLEVVRKHFTKEQEQLRLLASYSLESLTLMTPCVIPQKQQLYQCYLQALDRWFKLKNRREQHPRRSIDDDLAECLAIHKELLASAEEVRYPTSLHLLEMLKASHAHQDQPWQEIWQTYLLQQISPGTSNSYIYYQESILLWQSLFPDENHLRSVKERLSEDYTQSKNPSSRFAQRFLATVSADLRDLHDLLDPRDWQGLLDPRDWRYAKDWRYLQYFRYSRDLLYWRDWHDLRDLQYWLDWHDSRHWRKWSDLRYWRGTLLITTITKQAMQLLPSASETEAIDLCTILLGRVLQMQKTNEDRKALLEEMQHIVEATMQAFAKMSGLQTELREALLDILSYLPARSGEEITFIRQLAENPANQDQELQKALAQALRSARPNKDALPILQAATFSTNILVAEAVQEALEREQKRQQA